MFSASHRALRNMTFSFEYFPTKSVEATFDLWTAAQKLDQFNPAFVSVTCGANGSDIITGNARSDDAIIALQKIHRCSVAAHITAARQSRKDVLARAEKLLAHGVCDFVALRGDPEAGADVFTPHEEGFSSSIGLITALRSLGVRNIYVGAYPNKHPEAESHSAHADYLKRKFDAGATAAISQFFFDVEDFLRLRDTLASAGYKEEILPGLLPVNNWPKLQGFARKCGVDIPAPTVRGFENALRDGNFDLYATAHVLQLCDRLAQEGVKHAHLYTLNAAKLSSNLFAAMGLRAQKSTDVAA